MRRQFLWVDADKQKGSCTDKDAMRIWHLQWEKLAAEKDELLEKMKKESAAVIETSAAEAKAALTVTWPRCLDQPQR